MPKKILFVPVYSASIKTMVFTWQYQRADAGKPFDNIIAIYDSGYAKHSRRKAGLGRLRAVQPTDHLYVIAHGAGTHIGDSAAGKVYTPSEFADALVAEGLTPQLRHLTLYACFAGLAPNANTLSFAERLKNKLRNRGFTLVEVSGYTVALQGQYGAFPNTGGPIPAPGNMARIPGTGPVPARNHKLRFQ